jgi:hypothetical protein
MQAYAMRKYINPSPNISLISLDWPLAGNASFHAVKQRTIKSKTMEYMKLMARIRLSVYVMTQVSWIQVALRRIPRDWI